MLTLVLLLGLGVSLGLSVGERDAPAAWVRVWGGPTEGPTPAPLRVELISDSPASQLTLTAGIELRIETEGAEPITLPLRFDDQNTAYARVTERYPRFLATVKRGERRLASGAIQLGQARFWERRRVREGWFRGKAAGSWTIRVGCREGALALGHAGQLGVVVMDREGRPVRSRLEFEFDGLETDPAVASTGVVTDVMGRASVGVVPRDLSASVRIQAFDAQMPMANYFAAVPVASTALVGSVRDDEVIIHSGIPMPRVYYALVNEQGLWANGSLAGNVELSGPYHLSFRLAPMPSAPAWLMLGSEPSLDGPNVIGWPVLVPDSTFVPETIVVTEQLLLDGEPQVMAEAASRRSARFHRALAGFGLALLVLATAFAGPLLRSRGKAAGLLEQVPRDEMRGLLERRTPTAAFMKLLIVLGLGALLVWMRATLLGG